MADELELRVRVVTDRTRPANIVRGPHPRVPTVEDRPMRINEYLTSEAFREAAEKEYRRWWHRVTEGEGGPA